MKIYQVKQERRWWAQYKYGDKGNLHFCVQNKLNHKSTRDCRNVNMLRSAAKRLFGKVGNVSDGESEWTQKYIFIFGVNSKATIDKLIIQHRELFELFREGGVDNLRDYLSYISDYRFHWMKIPHALARKTDLTTGRKVVMTSFTDMLACYLVLLTGKSNKTCSVICFFLLRRDRGRQ